MRQLSQPVRTAVFAVLAAVARDNVWAVQSHPEKSSRVGQVLLACFVAGVPKEARPA